MGHRFISPFAILALCAATAWGAEEGPALYKSKCAMCHGGKGEGKPAIKAPALKGAKRDTKEIVERIAGGFSGSKAPHNKGMVSEEQARAVADYIKTLK